MANWQRWLNYGRAKLDDTLRSGNEELDRREAELAAEAEDKPWLRSEGQAPTLDEMRARIEHEAAAAAGAAETTGLAAPAPTPTAPANPPVAPSLDPAIEGIDFAEQQRQADARLAAIRSELGLDDPAAVGPPVAPPLPAAPPGPPPHADGPDPVEPPADPPPA